MTAIWLVFSSTLNIYLSISLKKQLRSHLRIDNELLHPECTICDNRFLISTFSCVYLQGFTVRLVPWSLTYGYIMPYDHAYNTIQLYCRFTWHEHIMIHIDTTRHKIRDVPKHWTYKHEHIWSSQVNIIYIAHFIHKEDSFQKTCHTINEKQDLKECMKDI